MEQELLSVNFAVACSPRRKKSGFRSSDELTIYFETAERAWRVGDVLRAVCAGGAGGGNDFAAGAAVTGGRVGTIHLARIAAGVVARADPQPPNPGIRTGGTLVAHLLRGCGIVRRAADFILQA